MSRRSLAAIGEVIERHMIEIGFLSRRIEPLSAGVWARPVSFGRGARAPLLSALRRRQPLSPWRGLRLLLVLRLQQV